MEFNLRQYGGSMIDISENVPLPVKCVAYCILLLLVDTIVAKGPCRTIVIRFFMRHQDESYGTMEERMIKEKRLCSQFAARFVGSLFLIMMFPFAFAALLDPEIRSNPLYAQSKAAESCIFIASGYFLYDVFICILRPNENNLEFLLHAVFCCCAYAYPILSGHLYHVGCSFMMWELSTPLLYLRWVMLKSGMAESKWMNYANYSFMAAFLGCRIIFGPIMSWQFWTSTQKDLAQENRGEDSIPVAIIYSYYVAMLVLNGLNFYWFGTMLRLALKAKKSKSH